VTPATVTLTALGDTQQFVAAAYDAAGDPVGGATFAWTSSTASIATMDPASGVATAAGQGTTTITASVGSVSGTAQLTVDLSGPGSGIASIVVTPASATLTSIGATQQYTAQAFDAGGQPISGVTFAWSSTSASVATVDAANGIATAVGNGTTTIEATVGGVTGSATLTVDLSGTGSGIASIVVTPASATLTSLGATQQFTAQAFDAGGQPVTGVTFAWSSTIGPIASIDAATGVATAAGHGTTTIEASAGGVTGRATLTVDLSGPGSGIAGITVTPSAATLGSIGATQQFTAQALDASGQAIFGVPFSWRSTNVAVATIDVASGLATAVDNGTTTIEASAGGVTGSATLTVAQQVASIQVAPSAVTLDALGQTQAFTAAAFDAHGVPIAGATFSWSSSVPTVGTIDASSGIATAVGNGQTIISASIGAVAGTAVLDVAQRVVSVAVAPSVVELTALGATAQFTATALDGSGNVVPGVVFIWSSSNPQIATIDPVTGLARTIDGGDAIISATAQGATGTAMLLVRP
jgi:phosphosulfolactate synthase (CoM biosynthesis protein A)